MDKKFLAKRYKLIARTAQRLQREKIKNREYQKAIKEVDTSIVMLNVGDAFMESRNAFE